MSKDPYCVKANRDSRPLANRRGWLRRRIGKCGPLHLRLERHGRVTTAIPVFDQKNCMYTPHVLAMDVGETFKVVTSDQTTHNIHPLPNPMTAMSGGISLSRREHHRSRRAGKLRN